MRGSRRVDTCENHLFLTYELCNDGKFFTDKNINYIWELMEFFSFEKERDDFQP